MRTVAKTRTAADWHVGYTTAEHVKAEISKWAMGVEMWPLTEIGGIVDGILDLVLIPMAMDAPIFKGLMAARGDWTARLGLVGVEVKVDRSDFKNGLDNGQFSRYDKDLCGLYIAGPKDVVVLKEVPPEHGVIHVGRDRIACRRHPRWKQAPPVSTSEFWRLMWAIAKQLRCERRREADKALSLERRIKEAAGVAIWKAINAKTKGAL